MMLLFQTMLLLLLLFQTVTDTDDVAVSDYVSVTDDVAVSDCH